MGEQRVVFVLDGCDSKLNLLSFLCDHILLEFYDNARVRLPWVLTS